jgi:hypothetical protein
MKNLPKAEGRGQIGQLTPKLRHLSPEACRKRDLLFVLSDHSTAARLYIARQARNTSR